jgi:hypothetical protein
MSGDAAAQPRIEAIALPNALVPLAAASVGLTVPAVLPGLQACDLATGTFPFAAAEIEVALQEFVGPLDSLQEIMDGCVAFDGPWPWICVGLVAVAASSELARRLEQLRTGARESMVRDMQMVQWFPDLDGPEM